jgi:hypothetical protein
MMNDENLGSAGASAPSFLIRVSSFSRQRFLDFARNDKNLI